MKRQIIYILLGISFVFCLFAACEGELIEKIIDTRGNRGDEDQTVNLFNLTALLPAPAYMGTPARVFENDQYTGTVEWAYSYTDENGLPVIDPIAVGEVFSEDGKIIEATISLTAKNGFTFTGVQRDVFSHDSMLSASNLPDSGTVIISFNALEPVLILPVTGLDLTAFVGAPVHWHQLPAADPIDTNEYTGNFEWFYIAEVQDGEDEHGVPIYIWTKTPIPAGEKLDFYKNNFMAEVSLTAKSGFTFAGIGKNAFTHNNAESVENEAGSGDISIIFSGKNVVFPDLSRGTTIFNCCGYRIGGWWDNWSASAMLAPLDTGNKSGWSNWFQQNWQGPSEHFWTTPVSDRGDVFGGDPRRPFNMAPNVEWNSFFSDSIVEEHVKSGHANKFEDVFVPETIRKPAHVFTLDLGMVLEITTLEFFPLHVDNNNGWDIERFGFGPFDGAPDNWPGWWEYGGSKQLFPIEFEIFYSTDVEIGPVPNPIAEPGIKTLGPMTFKPFHCLEGGPVTPYPGDDELEGPAWRSVNLYELMDNGIFEARYIHVRFYRNSFSNPWGWYPDQSRVVFNIGSLRIGMLDTF